MLANSICFTWSLIINALLAYEYYQLCWTGDSPKFSLLTLGLFVLVVLVELSVNTTKNSTI